MGKREGVTIYTRVMYTCSEIQYKVEGRSIKNISIKVRWESSVVDACYGPRNQEEEEEEKVDKAFFKQLTKAFKS